MFFSLCWSAILLFGCKSILIDAGIAREPVHQDRAPVVAVAGPVPPGPIRVPRRSAPSIVDAPGKSMKIEFRLSKDISQTVYLWF